MRLLPLFLLACASTGACTGTTDDTGDTGDEPADTDSAPRPKGSVTGRVLFADGTPVPDIEVQVCSIVCRYAKTDADGNFTQGELEAARFKIDAIGATYLIANAGDPSVYGNSLYGVDLGVDQAFTLPAPMVLPPAVGPVVANETAAEQTYEAGQVSLTFAGFEMPPFIARDNGDFDVYGGVLEGTELTSLWSVTPSFVVALLPWGAEPPAPMSLTVTGLTSPDGTYDVYALEEYGELQGPLGTATVTEGTATATGIQPEVWTWLMFVPA